MPFSLPLLRTVLQCSYIAEDYVTERIIFNARISRAASAGEPTSQDTSTVTMRCGRLTLSTRCDDTAVARAPAADVECVPSRASSFYSDYRRVMGTLKKILALFGFGHTGSDQTTESLLKKGAARSVGEAQPGRFPGKHVPPGDALQQRTLDVWNYLENHLLTPDAEHPSQSAAAERVIDQAEQPPHHPAGGEQDEAQQRLASPHLQAARPAAPTAPSGVSDEPASGVFVRPKKKGSRPSSSKEPKKESAKRSNKPAPSADQQDEQIEQGLLELEKVLTAEMHRLNSALSLREEQSQETPKAAASAESERASNQQKPPQPDLTAVAESPSSSAAELQSADDADLTFDIAEPAVLQHADTQELKAVLLKRSRSQQEPDSPAAPESATRPDGDSRRVSTKEKDTESHFEIVASGEDEPAEAEFVRIEIDAPEPPDSNPTTTADEAMIAEGSLDSATAAEETAHLEAGSSDSSLPAESEFSPGENDPAAEVQPPENTAIARDFTLWLADFLEIHGGIEGAAVVSSHGQLLAQQFRQQNGLAGSLEQITSLHKLAAMCNDALELGGINIIQLHGDERAVFIYAKEAEPLLIAWLAPDVPLGMVILEARKLTTSMAAALRESFPEIA